MFGNNALARIAPRAANVSVNEGWPRRHAARIFRAARSAFIEISGSPLAAENQANSAAGCPLNLALTCEPVRMSPGATVVAKILCCASSARTASEKPVSANLLAQYGAKWGTATFPPIDEMLTIRPLRCFRICGRICMVNSKGAQKCTPMQRSKSSRVI